MSRTALHSHTVSNVGNPERDITIVKAFDFGVSGDEEELILTDLIEGLQATLNTIPEEYRVAAVVRFRAYGDYPSMNVDVAFTRPENDTELADRKRWLASLDQEKEDRDAREFVRLQTKFQKL